MIAATAELPWLQDWIKWMKPCHWSSPSTHWYTTEMCHDRPRFPNQSVCDSLYLWGKNFIAQSLTIKTASGSRVSMISKRAWSWWADLSKWHIHDLIERVEEFARYLASSLSSSVANEASLTASMMLFRVECRLSHCSHISSWLWSHCCCRSGSVVSLRAKTLQWLATGDELLTWTYQDNGELSWVSSEWLVSHKILVHINRKLDFKDI